MPQVPAPTNQTPATVRIYHCACGVVYMEFPPDRICLVCRQQGKFKQVDFDSPNVRQALAL
jgi:hypothetical protein